MVPAQLVSDVDRAFLSTSAHSMVSALGSTSVCKSAFLQPDDTQVQVSCPTNNVLLYLCRNLARH